MLTVALNFQGTPPGGRIILFGDDRPMIRKKIDCHTHIVNSKIRDEYFSRTDGYAVVMQFPDVLSKGIVDEDSLNTVNSDRRLFYSPCIDISKEIPPQLKNIEEIIPKCPVVGLKIFLTYQAGKADDDRMLCIYEFARTHGLSVTFHTGSCSLVLPTANDMEGSRTVYIKNMAEKFPEVNFIAAHMDDPRFDECIQVMHGHDNIFTDFSGAYEPGTKEGADMQWAIDTFAKAINQYPDTYKQIVYGTDFCPPINLSAIDEYEYTISKIFTPDKFEDIYWNNCLRAFPKIKEYIGA